MSTYTGAMVVALALRAMTAGQRTYVELLRQPSGPTTVIAVALLWPVARAALRAESTTG
jgi:hypothetical protein